MFIYQLVCLPTQDTLDYLSQVFDASPIDLDPHAFHVEINSSKEIMEADPLRIYTAKAGTLDRFYDSSTQETSLLLPLYSDSLVERCAEVRQHAPSAFYGDHYFPFLVIKRNMPTMKPHRRALITSWSDTLYANHYPLTFEAEIVLHKEYNSVPDMDYYTTRMMDG